MEERKNITEYRRQLKQRILEYAYPAFATRGIRAVKMDDIADELQISKRTLYEIYANKEELLFEGLKAHQKEYDRKVKEYASSSDRNVMEIVLYVLNYHMKELGDTSAKFIADLYRYPAISEYFMKNKEEHRENFRKFLKRGVEEGYFRSDFNFDIMDTIINGIPQTVHTSDLYSVFPVKEVFYTMAQVIFRAICTSKGIDELEKFKLL